MAASTQIRIMISSRCNDLFPLDAAGARILSGIRADLKEKIEKQRVFGQNIYEVWINEEATADTSQSAWDHCMEQARECDIFIALFNGNAGWPDKNGTIGICHAELEAAYAAASGKVYIANIYEPAAKLAPTGAINSAFQAYVERLRKYDARPKNEAELLNSIGRIVSQSTVKMAQRGVRDASRGRAYVGPALDWTRQSYAVRVVEMRKAVAAALSDGDTGIVIDETSVQRPIERRPILFVVNAVPDAVSVAAAREMVGQPHLVDHRQHETLAEAHGGPVHIIACHKSVSESQARTMLGFPDATVVSAPFGIYVMDPVQSIQLVLLAQCRDETNTRLGVQRFLEWLDESGQAASLTLHARKRKAVVRALARPVSRAE